MDRMLLLLALVGAVIYSEEIAHLIYNATP